jgi:hypothetical protein
MGMFFLRQKSMEKENVRSTHWKIEVNEASHREADFTEARDLFDQIITVGCGVSNKNRRLLRERRHEKQPLLFEFCGTLKMWCVKYKRQGLFLPTGIKEEDIAEAEALLTHPNPDVFITGADKLGEFAFRLIFGPHWWPLAREVSRRLYSFLDMNEYLPLDLRLSSMDLFYFVNVTRPQDDSEFADRIFVFYEKLLSQVDFLANRNPPMEMPANVTQAEISRILKTSDLTTMADHAADIALKLLTGKVVNLKPRM